MVEMGAETPYPLPALGAPLARGNGKLAVMAEKTESGGNGRNEPKPMGHGQPLFFRNPFPLDKNRHAGKSMVARPNFSFAKKTNSVPIILHEFALVSKCYPIIFAPGEPALPIAVLGLEKDQNSFVDGDGSWADLCYIPAYIRRYPFVFFEDSDNDRLILCLDEDSDLIVDGDERPLFKDGEPTETVNSALELCTFLHQNSETTVTFCEALVEADLLVNRAGEAELSTGESIAVPGFRVVDEEKFNKLPDETFLEWRKKGWLALIYMHLASAQNWPMVAERTAQARVRGQ